MTKRARGTIAAGAGALLAFAAAFTAGAMIGTRAGGPLRYGVEGGLLAVAGVTAAIAAAAVLAGAVFGVGHWIAQGDD